MGKMITDNLLAQFSGFVESHMGLSFPQEKWPDLEKGLRAACGQFGGDQEETFIREFMAASLSRRQIEILAACLTVGETYFFREKNVLEAVKYLALAEIIRTRRGADQSIRIWSAGCAGGEEPYTIAMMLQMLVPDLKEWNITILATDINPLFLEKAVKGVYTPWSFREVPEQIINRFFIKQGDRFEILPEIKKMVTFSYHNLMQDDYPSLLNNTNAMDLIFCRNVLMYFSPETIKNVARRFHRCLTEGGRLIVSQTEVNDVYFPGFEKVCQAGAMFFVKPSVMRQTDRVQRGNPQTISLPRPLRVGVDRHSLLEDVSLLEDGNHGAGKIRKGVTEESLYEQADNFFAQGEYHRAEELLERLIESSPGHAEALSLLGRVCANQGRLDDALRFIEEAISVDTMNPGRHYLHASILIEMGRRPEAMTALKKAIYIDTDFALAYFAMGNLALGSGNRVEAERDFNTALLLLGKHSHDDILPEAEGMTAGRLMELIGSMQWRKTERRGTRDQGRGTRDERCGPIGC
ncbi:MAG TPA: chemotaxis protein CheR [Syntrophus sp. (in: bacteria)]|nr:chemotaxis protein CheR [Syntrophus sp. (in: bacteria)]